jgi:hypothetical protein
MHQLMITERALAAAAATPQALCGAVSRGDMPQLGNLLRAGADANAADYDRRTPLHVAAAESNLPAVRWGWCGWRVGIGDCQLLAERQCFKARCCCTLVYLHQCSLSAAAAAMQWASVFCVWQSDLTVS